MRDFPPFADTLITFTEGQISALQAYDQTYHDEDARRGTLYHLQAWDRHFGRECTLTLRERRNKAFHAWQGWIFQDGAGI